MHLYPSLWAALFGVASGPTGTVTITMPTTVDEIDGTNDLGAVFLGSGAHTLYGSAVYFDADRYLWTSVNGVGVDPGVSGTGHEVALTGSAPFSASAWASAAETVIAGAGYSVARSAAELSVTVSSPARATAAAAAQAALTSFDGRGDGYVIGSTQQAAGASVASNTTGWIQVLPADVPSGAFRVIGLGVRRGSNVTNGVMVSLASGGTADYVPTTAVVDHYRTMGNSGAGNWHYEFLDTPIEYSGGERLWLATHGDGASSSVYGGNAVNDGTAQNGGTNLWLTDGTSGSTTPPVSPVGAVTASFNYGIAVRAIIQVAPYQTDGGYRVIGGAVPGRHDGTLYGPGTPVDDIFVTWRFTAPPVDDISLMDFGVRLQAHASGAANQLRFELWDAAGGASTFVGDSLVGAGLIGVTSDAQGTGWSRVTPSSPIALSSSTTYRWSVKGEPLTPNDTIMDVWLGTAGADTTTLAGHPSAYAPSGTTIPGTERETDGNVDETALDFDPAVATASPNNANGTIISPNNLSMTSLYLGKPAPTVVAS
jgi:hypothetical protein